MSSNVGIIGVGMTKFGEHWDRRYRDLIVDAGVDARNIYYKISPEVQSILGQLITVLDRLEDRTNLSISEFLQTEIEKRVSVSTKIYTKKIRHGFILIVITLEKNGNLN